MTKVLPGGGKAQSKKKVQPNVSLPKRASSGKGKGTKKSSKSQPKQGKDGTNHETEEVEVPEEKSPIPTGSPPPRSADTIPLPTALLAQSNSASTQRDEPEKKNMKQRPKQQLKQQPKQRVDFLKSVGRKARKVMQSVGKGKPACKSLVVTRYGAEWKWHHDIRFHAASDAYEYYMLAMRKHWVLVERDSSIPGSVTPCTIKLDVSALDRRCLNFSNCRGGQTPDLVFVTHWKDQPIKGLDMAFEACLDIFKVPRRT